MSNRFGKYELIQKVHRKTPHVQHAIDTETGKEVVVKFADPYDKTSHEAFIRESFALQRMDRHERIVPVYEILDDDYAIVLPKLDGSSIATILRDQEIPLNTCKILMGSILEGIVEMHAQGFIHRDIKPSNIMATPQPVIIDFGTAYHESFHYLEASDWFVGTPEYTSPEMCKQDAGRDHRQDIYSLGITFFEMLTGERPYGGSSAFHILEQHMNCRVPAPTDINPNVSVDLSDIVLQATESEPADRFATAHDMLEAVARASTARSTVKSTYRSSRRQKEFREDNTETYLGTTTTVF